MTEKEIERINELYHKSKNEGLTPEEKTEQQNLRQAYLAAIRMNIRSQLDNADIVAADGSVKELKQIRLKNERKKYRS